MIALHPPSTTNLPTPASTAKPLPLPIQSHDASQTVLEPQSIPNIPKVHIIPNSAEERALLQQLAEEPYGAKPVLMMNTLNVENSPDIGDMTPIKLKNGAQGYFQQALNRPTACVEFVLPLFPDDAQMHLSNSVLLNGTLAKKKLLSDLQGQGITVESLVTQDHFTLLVNGPTGQEKKLLALGLDFLKTPETDEKEYESSRTIVMQNLLNLSNKPDFQKAESLQRARLGEGHPYSKSTLQTIMEVQTLNPQATIQQFKASYAHPELTQIAMVSALSPEQQASLFNQVAQDKAWKTNDTVAPPTAGIKIPPVKEKNIKTPILVSDNRLDRVHMSTLWKAPEVGTEDHPSFVIMKNLMGGMTGSLFKTMRTERGLVYSVSSGIESNKHYGEYEVSEEIDGDKLSEAIDGQQDAINTYVKAAPSEQELDKVKRRIIHTMRDTDVTSLGIMSNTSNRLRDGLPPISRQALQESYLNVSAGDVEKTAQKYLGPQAWHVEALTGPESILAKQFPGVSIQEREHYLTDNVDNPKKGHIYVQQGDAPMYPAEYVLDQPNHSKTHPDASLIPLAPPKPLNVNA
jgi:predicted Zn-dependent peptidase